MYFVFYTKGCTPNVREFKTLKAAKTFADKVDKKDPGTFNTDNWVDFIIKGKIIQEYKGSRGIVYTKVMK